MTEMASRLVCVALFVALPVGSSSAAPLDLNEIAKGFGPPVMRIARPDEPPKIDGQLDDPAWKDAEPVALGLAVGGWTDPAAKTEARLLADSSAMYISVRCLDPTPELIVSATAEQLAKVNTGDTVEVFLDPGHKETLGQYYHVVINPNGDLYTARGQDSKAWTPKLTAKTQRDAAGWTVELAVPLEDLGVAKDAIPRVWGLNVNRQRPELGVKLPKGAVGAARFRPEVRPLDEPEKYRDGEYSGWSPTYSDYSYWDSRPFHHPKRFGHAVLEVGALDVAPPPRLFEVLYRSDFDSGAADGFENGILIAESFRGPGKSYSSKPGGKQTLYLKHPLADLEDVYLIMAFRLPKDGRLYHYARTPDGWKCGATRHEFFITREAAAGRKVDQAGYALFPTFDLYDTHADKIAWKPWGRLWKGPGPWSLVTGYLSEPSESAVIYPGTDWAVLRMRLGEFRRYAGRSPKAPSIPGQIQMPRDASYPGGLVFYPAPGPLQISELVIFRGADFDPPQPPENAKSTIDGDTLHISWDRSPDNTLTAFYRVRAGDELLAETHGLSVNLSRAKANNRPLTVTAHDFYDNASEPAVVGR